MRLAKLGVVFLLLISSSVFAQLPNFSRIVSFGDSLTDTGNDEPTNSDYYPKHHSNGIVWVEYLADKLGLARPTPSKNGGYNYGNGGNTTDRVLQQVDSYLASRTFDRNALFSINGGGNDASDSSAAVAFGIDDGSKAAVANNLLSATTKLVNAGARNIMVHSVPKMGLVPMGGAFGTDWMVGNANSWAAGANAMLKAGLDNLEAANPTVNIIWVDTYGLMDNMENNPSAYGFDHVHTNCYIGEPFGDGALLAGANPDKYLFWDMIHPTTKGHSHFADQAYADLVAQIPEPATISVLALGGLALLRKRKQKTC